MDHHLTTAVQTLLRTVAAEQILSRFRRLGDGDVVEKSAGEPVTVADREAERALADGLRRIDPGARFIGEEACATDPRLIERLGEGRVWLVDPLDGTANFAAGRDPFAVMVALLENGVTLAAWVLDPLTDRVVSAGAGSGARVDGRPVPSKGDLPPDDLLDGIVSSAFIPEPYRDLPEQLVDRIGRVRATRRCAGHEYPLVALGACDFALYWRTLPWDHAAGALIVEEAGGAVLRLDGSRYRPTVGGSGILVARTKPIAQRLMEMLR